MSLLRLLVEIIQSSCLLLFNVVSHLEVALAGLLRRYDFGVIHVNLVHSVVVVGPKSEVSRLLTSCLPIEVPEDMLSELVVRDKVPCFVSSDQLVHVGVNLNFELAECVSELILPNLTLGIVLNHLSHFFLEGVDGLLGLVYRHTGKVSTFTYLSGSSALCGTSSRRD